MKFTKFNKKRKKELEGMLGSAYIIFGSFLLISLLSFQGKYELNWLGLIGHSCAYILRYIFGISDFLLIFYLIALGFYLMGYQSLKKLNDKWIYLAIVILATTTLLNVIQENNIFEISRLKSRIIDRKNRHGEIKYYLGGIPSYYIYKEIPYVNLKNLFSDFGVTILCVVGILFSIIGLLELHLFYIAQKIKNWKTNLIERIKTPLPSETKQTENYLAPHIKLLTPMKNTKTNNVMPHVEEIAETLVQTLASFGIEVTIGNIYSGPTITSLEVHPSSGVKVQKIKSLENDIALNLQAKSIRIVAPIPGKAAVGIEIPSIHPQEVGFKEILNEYIKAEKKYTIPILLGKTVSGDNVIFDLTKMPHCIISGATGSGKSVCINTIIMSILMNLSPDFVRLVLIDPKKVELTPFANIPHLATPVITDADSSISALNWLVKEMEYRYELFKRMKLRNISSFNSREIDKEFESSLEMEVPEQLKFIVCIIDEFADLVITTSIDMETPIIRIAQMARAVGIHLILATQRPSREVITGLIKANFPTRISFKVSSRINSQIVLDENGAESLLGNGDLLFMPPDGGQLMRCQGAYVSDKDIYKIVEELKSTIKTEYMIKELNNSPALPKENEKTDKLYEKALEIIVTYNIASTTFLQRKLKIGYARAASLMDALEENGVVARQEGSKARKIVNTASNKSPY